MLSCFCGKGGISSIGGSPDKPGNGGISFGKPLFDDLGEDADIGGRSPIPGGGGRFGIGGRPLFDTFFTSVTV